MKMSKRIRRRFIPEKADFQRIGSLVRDFVHRRHPFAGPMLKNVICRYFCGDRAGHRSYYRVAGPLTDTRPLYHLTYSSRLADIMKNDLKGYDYVYLTDDPRYGDEYFEWCDRVGIREEGRCIILRIDTAELLRRGHPVFWIERKGELITDFVPASCVSDVSEYHMAQS